MNTIETSTVAEIAATSLATVRVFEKYGIDYCCGGKRPLAEACLQNGHSVDTVREELAAALIDSPKQEHDWTRVPLHQLIRHITEVHHGYLRSELPATQARLDKVYRIYNQRYGPSLIGLPQVFAELRAELEPHMEKEEMVLFPAIRALESAAAAGRPGHRMPFGTIANPIRMMESDHEIAGDALRRIREITKDFELPVHACVTYKALMIGLSEIERDLHLHIHLENNILFPRAVVLERARSSGLQARSAENEG